MEVSSFNCYNINILFNGRNPKITDFVLFKNLVAQGLTDKQLAEKFDVSVGTILSYRNKLNIPTMHKQKVAERENIVFNKLRNRSSADRVLLAKELGVCKATVDRIAQEYNIWELSGKLQDEQVAKMINSGMKTQDIAENLGLTVSSITRIAKKLGLQLNKISNNDMVLEKLAEGKTNKQIAKELGLTENTIANIKKQNGLTRTYNRLQGPQLFKWVEICEESRQVTVLRELFTRFKKGERTPEILEEMSSTLKHLQEVVDGYKKRFN